VRKGLNQGKQKRFLKQGQHSTWIQFFSWENGLNKEVIVQNREALKKRELIQNSI